MIMKEKLLNIELDLKPARKLYWQNLTNTGKALAISSIIQQTDKPILIITEDVLTANSLLSLLHFFNKKLTAKMLMFPDWETLAYDQFSPHADIIAQRLLTLSQLISNNFKVLIIPLATLMHKLPPRDYIEKHSLLLKIGDEVVTSSLCKSLIKKGYYQVTNVFQHGEFALRGSLLDLFPTGHNRPYRIDFFDNTIDNIRTFDTNTQRSLKTIETIKVLPAREIPIDQNSLEIFKTKWEQLFPKQASSSIIYNSIIKERSIPGIEYYLPLFFTSVDSIFSYLPENIPIIRDGDLVTSAESFWQTTNQRYEQLRYDTQHPILPPSKIFIPVDQLFQLIQRAPQIQIGATSAKKQQTKLPFNTLPDFLAPNKEKQLTKLKEFIATNPGRVLFSAESPGRQEILINTLNSIKIHPHKYTTWDDFIADNEPIGICIAPIQEGIGLDNLLIIPEAAILGKYVQQRQAKKSQYQDHEAAIKNLDELKIGDPIVHIEYGIGKYLGIETIDASGYIADYLILQYADDAKLYVPITSLHLISRFLGGTANIAYTKLGSKQWEKAKQKATEKICDVAAELLDVYARRKAKKGFAFVVDPAELELFTYGFPFETTKDQQTAIDAVINDMSANKTMDRLVCGDVGFGKTEVAMRATFLATQNHKQVVILAPTTLLAQQHYTNFADRFSEWPVKLALLSRFNTAKEQQQIIAKLKQGTIDIIIGTHKLLQEKIAFKNLGLLIIDEEQRFGVKQKEKIKAMRTNVDILTLTATPIPRTLSLALTSIRDLSIIATPPVGRLAIKTFVQQYNKQSVRDAILREALRGGQVYFLHNEVATIAQKTQEIAQLLPSIDVAYAHGQMAEKQLEKIMSDFYHQKFNILVCTTIIETGIDIPTANTIIINRADRFGLAQLHQLRGRVGRSHHQAYAYLLIPPKEAMTKDAAKRIAAIKSMDELGSGFTLASHDLEIRGAGEILGEKQTGQIHTIGYNLYIEFLDEAVQALKMGQDPHNIKPLMETNEIEIQIPALIPEQYIRDVQTRLTFYKRIASCANRQELEEIQVELIDRFGLLPNATKNLFLLSGLKQKTTNLGIKKIKASSTQGYLEFIEQPLFDPILIINLIQQQPNIYKLSNNKLQFKLINKTQAERLIFIDTLIEQLSAIKENKK
jgi:transcription-repair coupling factor (superfamily II helicase)